MIGIAVGLLVSQAAEWGIHKYVLHGSGKRRESYWSFHFHEHHRASRRGWMRDDDYAMPPWSRSAQRKELLGLIGLVGVQLPLAPVAPFYVATVTLCAVRYYYVHRKAHLDPDWAREHLPWHVDHHLGLDQDKNWGVTTPWMDMLLGTRVRYVGTLREREDRAHWEARRAAAGRAVNGEEAA